MKRGNGLKRLRVTLASAAILIVLHPPSSIAADLDLGTYRVRETASRSESLAVADFDGDGALDFAAASATHDEVTVALGDGNGGLEAGVVVRGGGHASALIAFDANGDRHVDLVSASFTRSRLSLMPGDGSGGFGPAFVMPTEHRPRSLAAGDFDGDGDSDLAVSFEEIDEVHVLLGDGMGGFATHAVLVAQNEPRAVLVADFDENGVVDLAVGNQKTGTVSVFLGDGAARFSAGRHFDFGTWCRDVCAGDTDGDGNTDLAVADEFEDRVVIRLGDSHGFFSPRVESASNGQRPVVVAIADWDEDGLGDILVGNVGDADDGSGSNVVFFSSPIGGSGIQPRSMQFHSPAALVAGDVDGDGHQDFSVSSVFVPWISVVTGDGQGGFSVPVRSIGGLDSLTVADFDGDGLSDFGGFNDSRVAVALSGHDESFRFVSSLSEPTMRSTGADFDLDGNEDLAATTLFNWIVVHLGNGDGTFGLPKRVPTSRRSTWPVAGDVDADGIIDIVAVGNDNSATASATFLAGDGLGSFIEGATFSVPYDPRSPICVDIDEDGRLDLLVAGARFNGGPGVLSCHSGDGFGGFTPSHVVEPDGTRVGSFAVEDVDSDGHPDVALATNAGRVHVVFGDGPGLFGERVSLPVEGFPNAVAIADLNEDGLFDLAVSKVGENVFGPRGVAVVPGVGPRTFGSAIRFNVAEFLGSLVIGDFQGDGHADIAVHESDISPAVWVLFNRTFEPLDARRGNVNAGAGPTTDALFANGSRGDGGERRLLVDRTEPFTVRMEAPPSRPLGPSRFVLYAWIGVPRAADRERLPFGLGTSAMPTPLSGGSPALRRVWNNIGKTGLLGSPALASSRAPSEVLDLRNGIRRATTFYLQGLILDSDAPSGVAAVTNGIVVTSD